MYKREVFMHSCVCCNHLGYVSHQGDTCLLKPNVCVIPGWSAIR